MAAPMGNQNNKKLKSKEIKTKVYKDYCEHIARGYSHKSWSYDKNGLTLSWVSIETYIKNDIDFDTVHKEIAISKSLRLWEDLGKEMMMGKIKGAQPAIFQIFMRNKFGYDRNDTEKVDNKSMFNNWFENELKSKKKVKVA